MAAMALEDKIQAAVERQVAAVSAGHAQELQNVQDQLQQTLERRTQVLSPACGFHPILFSMSHAAGTSLGAACMITILKPLRLVLLGSQQMQPVFVMCLTPNASNSLLLKVALSAELCPGGACKVLQRMLLANLQMGKHAPRKSTALNKESMYCV